MLFIDDMLYYVYHKNEQNSGAFGVGLGSKNIKFTLLERILKQEATLKRNFPKIFPQF